MTSSESQTALIWNSVPFSTWRRKIDARMKPGVALSSGNVSVLWRLMLSARSCLLIPLQ